MKLNSTFLSIFIGTLLIIGIYAYADYRSYQPPGANTTLSNLGTTAINADLNPDGTTRKLGSTYGWNTVLAQIFLGPPLLSTSGTVLSGTTTITNVPSADAAKLTTSHIIATSSLFPSETFVSSVSGTTVTMSAAALAGVSGTQSITFDGQPLFKTTNATGSNYSAPLVLRSGTVSTGTSGSVNVQSGNATGALGNSGTVSLRSGSATTGTSGAWTGGSGNTSSSGSTGLTILTSGASSSGGTTGDVQIQTGTTTGTRGSVKLFGTSVTYGDISLSNSQLSMDAAGTLGDSIRISNTSNTNTFGLVSPDVTAATGSPRSIAVAVGSITNASSTNAVGDLVLDGGSFYGTTHNGGRVEINGGFSNQTTGGAVDLFAGTGVTGGPLSLFGGYAYTSGSTGGNVNIFAGPSTGSGGTGGDVNLAPGFGNSGGFGTGAADGAIKFWNGNDSSAAGPHAVAVQVPSLANDYTMKFPANVSGSIGAIYYIGINQAIVDCTNTLSVTPTDPDVSIYGKCHRDGQYLVVDGKVKWTGTGSAGNVTVSIASLSGSPVIDVAALPTGACNGGVNQTEERLGHGQVFSQGAGSWFTYDPVCKTTTTFEFAGGSAHLSETAVVSGSALNFTAKMPIVNWN